MADYRSIQTKEGTSLDIVGLCFRCDQDCCTRLSQLKLSKAEFERNFLHHSESLLIKEYRGIYVVSERGNGCPNLRGNRCAVYEIRPIECRLFPYTIGSCMRIGRLVVMTYHHRTRCQQKHHLLAPRAEVVDMLVGFAKDAFGRDVRVAIVPDIVPLRLARFLKRLRHKIARAVAQAARGGGRVV